jgi:hypothetical protein
VSANRIVFTSQFTAQVHRLHVELDLQSLLGLLYTAVLIGLRPNNSPRIPPAFGLIYEGAIGQQR